MYEIMKRNKQDYIYIYYIIRKTVGARERERESTVYRFNDDSVGVPKKTNHHFMIFRTY